MKIHLFTASVSQIKARADHRSGKCQTLETKSALLFLPYRRQMEAAARMHFSVRDATSAASSYV
jgi:hypothetical protein